jgi:hypothetical protein
MPSISCPKCAQEYDVPAEVAASLPGGIALCHCGAPLSGSKAAVLARALGSKEIREIDLQPYRIEAEHKTAPIPALVAPQATAAPRPPAAPPSRTVLLCVEGALSGQEFEIPPTGLIVGREGHVRVPDEFLSRRHFELFLDADGAIRVRDLGSRNGTFLNAVAARDTRVHAGDEIRAGENSFRIEQRA